MTYLRPPPFLGGTVLLVVVLTCLGFYVFIIDQINWFSLTTTTSSTTTDPEANPSTIRTYVRPGLQPLALLERDRVCNLDSNRGHSFASSPSIARLSPWNAFEMVRPKSETRRLQLRIWMGRVGNNVAQIRHALRYAVCCNTELVIACEHTFLPFLSRVLDFTRLKRDSISGNVLVSERYKNEEEVKHASICKGPLLFSGAIEFQTVTEMPLNITGNCFFDEVAAASYVLFKTLLPSKSSSTSSSSSSSAMTAASTTTARSVQDDKHSIKYNLSLPVSLITGHPLNKTSPGFDCPTPDIDTALVIHLRSGDIFSHLTSDADNRIDISYRQPPVAFYERIFLDHDIFTTVIFVTEPSPHLNPVWTYYKTPSNPSVLRQRHIHLEFQATDWFDKDFNTLMCARYFVPAASTFSTVISDFAPFLKNIYYFEGAPINLNDVNVRQREVCSYVIHDYFGREKMSRLDMLKHPLENVRSLGCRLDPPASHNNTITTDSYANEKPVSTHVVRQKGNATSFSHVMV